MIVDVDKIVVSLDVVSPDAVIVEASAVAPSGIVTEAVAELPTQVVVISHEETPTVTPLEIIDYGSTSIECAFDVTTEQAEEVVKGVLCGTTNPPTFENADYRLLHGQGSMDLAFAGLHVNTEYYLRPYALSNLGYKYGDVVAQRTKANPIPEEYQLVEYLESKGIGTQYIDTLLTVSRSLKWEYDYCFLRGGEDQNGGSLFASERFLIANLNHLYIGMGSGIETSISVLGVRHKYTLDPTNNRYGVDENFYSFTSSLSAINYNVYLFARNTQGDINHRSIGRCFNSKFYLADVLVRDMYPVYRKADNKPGMYDIVNNVFYTNQGSGEFLVGPDKEWEE